MKQYIVDTFTDKIFSGNPAAVCVLDSFPSEDIMQSIAAENNLSETAFVVKENDRYHIRWFNPKKEIDFCGHATLAAAYVLFNFYAQDTDSLDLYGQIGEFKYLKRSSNGRIRFLVKYCGLKRLSSSVEAALTMEAEKATAIASDSIEMPLMIKKCIKEDTYFRFSRRFRFVKWYFAQCLLRCFGCYFAVAKLWVVIYKRVL